MVAVRYRTGGTEDMAALVALEAEILRIVGEEPVGGTVLPLRLAS